MLRERNSWKDVVFNWIMLLTVIMPLAGFAMVGATWFTFWMLGVPGM
jgi:nitrate reductase NapE component